MDSFCYSLIINQFKFSGVVLLKKWLKCLAGCRKMCTFVAAAEQKRAKDSPKSTV